VALIEEAAQRLTGGNKTEAVALALRRLLEQNARAGSLFGAHRGSVRVREGVKLIVPALDVEPDAETGREVERRAIAFCSTPISPSGSTVGLAALPSIIRVYGERAKHAATDVPVETVSNGYT